MATPFLRIYLAVLLIACVDTAGAQNQKLSIGDVLPDVVMKDVINYPAKEIRLSDFKGRYVVLDFWNHNCHYCIASFRNIDSMQKLFGSKLQIILVNREEKRFTEEFFRTRKQIKMPGVPMATGNTQLISLFPKDGYPYSVWIDPEGVIRQMTLAHNMTVKNLGSFVGGEALQLSNAARKIFYGPLFHYKSDSLENKIGYYSSITRYVDDLNIGFTELARFNESLIELSSSGSSILELYKKAYREGDKYNFNEEGSVQLKVKDTSVYVRPANPDLRDEWNRRHSYNYTLFLPVSRHQEAYQMMQEDLRRYFGLKASVISKGDEKPSHVLVIEE